MLCRINWIESRQSIGSGLVFAALVLAGCAVSPIKGYQGEKLPRDEIATLRVVGPGRLEIDAPGYMLLEVEIDHPVSGEPVDSRSVSRLDRSPLIAIPAGNQCLIVRSRPVRCPSMLEEIVGIASAEVSCQSVGLGNWAEQEVCFDADRQAEYEIEVHENRTDFCMWGLEVAGFRLIDRNTGELIEAYENSDTCSPVGT